MDAKLCIELVKQHDKEVLPMSL